MIDARFIAEGFGADVLREGSATGFQRVVTDSRLVEEGDLFVALPGARTAGEEHLTEVWTRGAWGAVVGRPVEAPADRWLFRVGESYAALAEAGRRYRLRFAVETVGVTGSVGKTSTKDLVAAVLRARGPVLQSEGNYNTNVGLPLTLFRLQPEQRWAVLEMGMRSQGEIAELCRIASPRIGVITNIGPSHLESLGSMERIAAAKGELLAGLVPGGKAVLNGEDPRLRALAASFPGEVLWVGLQVPAGETAPAITAREIHLGESGSRFRLVTPVGEAMVDLPLLGLHQIKNALLAAGVGVLAHLSVEEIAAGLAAALPARGRSQLLPIGPYRVLDDSYNASPVSMEAALRFLESLSPTGARVAVLGDMLELGEASSGAHRTVAALAGRITDRLLLVGPHMREGAEAAREAGMDPERIHWAVDREAALITFRSLLQPGDTILVKGSRGMGLERLIDALRVW